MALIKEQQERLQELLKLAYDVEDALSHPVDSLDDLTPLWKLYLRHRIALSVRIKVDVRWHHASHYLIAEFETLSPRMERDGDGIGPAQRRVAFEATSDKHEYRIDEGWGGSVEMQT